MRESKHGHTNSQMSPDDRLSVVDNTWGYPRCRQKKDQTVALLLGDNFKNGLEVLLSAPKNARLAQW